VTLNIIISVVSLVLHWGMGPRYKKTGVRMTWHCFPSIIDGPHIGRTLPCLKNWFWSLGPTFSLRIKVCKRLVWTLSFLDIDPNFETHPCMQAKSNMPFMVLHRLLNNIMKPCQWHYQQIIIIIWTRMDDFYIGCMHPLARWKHMSWQTSVYKT
jgi:hypothetical protein